MKNLFKITLLISLFLLILYACKKDEEIKVNSDVTTRTDNPDIISGDGGLNDHTNISPTI